MICAAGALHAQTQSIDVTYNRTVIYMKDGSKVCYDFDDISKVRHAAVAGADDALNAGIRDRAVTDKSRWTIAYGSLAMPFGPYSAMIDGREDDGGWMGYINDGHDDAPGLGNPFAVIDLGEPTAITAMGITAGVPGSGACWDVMPAKVEFYVTDGDVPALLSDDERAIVQGCDEGDLTRYFPLHARMRQADASVAWKKVGEVHIARPDAAHTARYMYVPSDTQLSGEGITSRYVKLEVTPFGTDRAAADRTKIFEFHLRTRAE